MSATMVSLTPIPAGWAVTLTDGRILARFRGPFSRRRALAYLSSFAGARRR